MHRRWVWGNGSGVPPTPSDGALGDSGNTVRVEEEALEDEDEEEEEDDEEEKQNED